MHKEAKLSVQKRNEAGSAACRRLRRQGIVPGNVYGHNMAPLPALPGRLGRAGSRSSPAASASSIWKSTAR
ncbi:MAG: hypothetical protein U0872_11820 [Planctomycetaceae bacterium]